MSKKETPVETPVREGTQPGRNGGTLKRGGKHRPAGGRPPNEFRLAMRELSSSESVEAYLRDCLAGKFGPKFFLGALAYTTDRGYGKASQTVEVYDFNPDDFSDAGLDRVAAGEDPMHVLTTGGRAIRNA